MKLLVTGDRYWGRINPEETPQKEGRPTALQVQRANAEREYLKLVLDQVNLSPGIDELIHGGAKGADNFAGVWARENDVTERVFPADWERHGKGAGPIRNRQMLYEANPDSVIAFHRDFEHSKGTKDMVMVALKAGLMVIIHPSPVR